LFPHTGAGPDGGGHKKAKKPAMAPAMKMLLNHICEAGFVKHILVSCQVLSTVDANWCHGQFQ
jgi:hypothetical protein